MNKRDLPSLRNDTPSVTTILKCKQILSQPYFGNCRTSSAIPDWNERVVTCI
jgi:hypothetical protein